MNRRALLLSLYFAAVAALVTCAPLAPWLGRLGTVRMHVAYAIAALLLLRRGAFEGLRRSLRQPGAVAVLLATAGALVAGVLVAPDWMGRSRWGVVLLVPLGALVLLAEIGRRGLRFRRAVATVDGLGVLLVLGAVAAIASSGDLDWLVRPGLVTLGLWSLLHFYVQAAAEELAFRETFARLLPANAALLWGSLAYAVSHGLVGLPAEGAGNILQAVVTNLGLGLLLGLMYREGGLLAASAVHGLADGLLSLVGPTARLIRPGSALLPDSQAQTYHLLLVLGFYVAAILWGLRAYRRRSLRQEERERP